MTQANDFSAMERAPTRVPVWYWNRQALLKLRAAIRNSLQQAGIGNGMKVLELGCGNRPYQPMVEATGAKYIGADLQGNAHADLIIADDGHVPAADGLFDAVLSTQVLEHVPDPVAYLGEVRRLLKPGGQLILSTHGVWVYHPSPGDYWRWTGAGLRKLLEDQQFEVREFTGVMGTLPMALQLAQDSINFHLPRLLRKPFCLIMQLLIAGADRLHSDEARARDSMIFVVLARPRAI
ncbi:MAG: class I SAM-dependent methyltransferase [Pseudomonadota bacterium]|nr:class I SAM-dependent methyltransferase [Pseudomonadota bacterium]